MLKYDIFYKTLMSVIQNSGLDVGAVYFILKDILHEIEKLYEQCLANAQISESKQTDEVNISSEEKTDEVESE